MTPSEIETLLRAALSPSHLEVIDQSAQHAGHRPGAPSEGTHWAVTVVSEAFLGLSRLERHRLVYDTILKRAASEQVHALALRALTPEEWRPAPPPAGARSI